MANYYEVASKKLDDWIIENPERVKDFENLSHGLSISMYLAKYAYIEDFIGSTFKQLRYYESNRILKSWYSV
jgi:hypothetical protein